VVMLTVPLKAIPDLARDVAPALSGKIVLDTGNAYERRDGALARGMEFEPDTAPYNTGMNGPQLRTVFGPAVPDNARRHS